MMNLALPNPDDRAAGAALINEGVEAGPKRKTLIFVNNRMEGNALAAMISAGGESRPGRG